MKDFRDDQRENGDGRRPSKVADELWNLELTGDGNSGDDRQPIILFLLRRCAQVAAKFVAAGFILSLGLTFIYRFAPVPVTPLMMIRLGEALVHGREIHFKKNWVAIDEMSPKLEYAMIAAEDMRFFEHNGFDWEAIDKALKHNERSRRIRGGSTISQQVAKNVFLWPERSWVRKGLEAYFTTLIETFWPKRRIMEVYLNVIEFGDGVYGVGAASQLFYKKPPLKVSSSEAALLAAVLPNPRLFSVAHPSVYTRFRQTMIQRRMNDAAESVPEDD